MRVSKRTKYKNFIKIEPYLSAQSIEDLKKASEKACGNMYDLTFGQFYNCVNGDFSHVLNEKEPTVFQIYWVKRFADFAPEFAKKLQALTLPPTEDEKRASSNLLKVDWSEAVLVFLRGFFGLSSFREAEQITIGELLIAKRAQYNQDKYTRELSKIQRQKIGKK